MSSFSPKFSTVAILLFRHLLKHSENKFFLESSPLIVLPLSKGWIVVRCKIVIRSLPARAICILHLWASYLWPFHFCISVFYIFIPHIWQFISGFCILHLCRAEICPCRHCRRQCKIFASCVNFSIFTFFVCFSPLKLLKLGEIDGVKFLAWKSGGVNFWTNFMSEW